MINYHSGGSATQRWSRPDSMYRRAQQGRAVYNSAKDIFNRLKSYASRRRSVKKDARRAIPRRLNKNSATQFSTPQAIGLDGESVSNFNLTKPDTSHVMGKLYKDWCPSDQLNNFGVRTETTSVGTQYFLNMADYFTDTDVNLMFTAQSATAASTKIFLKSVYAESMIKNQANSSARIKIFDVLAKKDTNATTTDPGLAWTLGFADAGAGGAAADYLIVGKTPYTNARFAEFFKILNTTDVTLHPGATHTHKTKYSPNRMLSKEIANDIGGTGIGGLTLYTFMIYYGVPINAVDTQTEVTSAAISLDVVSFEEYKYFYCHPNVKVSDVNNTLDAALSTAGATMQDTGVEGAADEA